jgi:hypothetical protein
MAALYEQASTARIHGISQSYAERAAARAHAQRGGAVAAGRSAATAPGAAPGGNAAQRAQGYYN